MKSGHGGGGRLQTDGGGRLFIRTPPWICALLNFSKGGRPGTIGHSGNVSESEQRQARRRLPLTRLFISVSSSLHRLRPAPFHSSVVVFYLHLTSTRRKTAQPFNRRGLWASFLHFSDASLNLNLQISSHHTFLSFIVHPAFLLRSLVCR